MLKLYTDVEGFQGEPVKDVTKNGVKDVTKDGVKDVKDVKDVKPTDISQLKLSNETITKYNKFKTFYNDFMINWKKAVTSLKYSVRNTTPDKKLDIDVSKGPSETKIETPTIPTPSMSELNAYINSTITTSTTQYPQVTEELPEITSATLAEILLRIPKDYVLYKNALTLMNNTMEKGFEDIQKLSADIKNLQGFEDKCSDISNCLSNPDVIAKIAEGQKMNEINNFKLNEKTLVDRITTFFSPEMEALIQKNKELNKMASDFQAKAESGELMSSFATEEEDEGDEEETLEERLERLKREDPKKYNETMSSMNNNPLIMGLIQTIRQLR